MSHRVKSPTRKGGSTGKQLRIHGLIARNLGVMIVSGQYKPGDVLEGEVASSEQLQVSRTAYREAVKILAAKGLVESRPKVGTRVSPRDQWQMLDPEVLSWVFQGEPDEATLRCLFELRTIVEPSAAALAARRRTDAQLKEMRDALDAMARHTVQTDAGRFADQHFHTVMLQATANPFLISMHEGVASAINHTTVFKQRAEPLMRDPVPDHEKVFRAIEDQDPVAAQEAMADLIRLALLDTPIAHWADDKKDSDGQAAGTRLQRTGRKA